jgi:hypothetical protein
MVFHCLILTLYPRIDVFFTQPCAMCKRPDAPLGRIVSQAVKCFGLFMRIGPDRVNRQRLAVRNFIFLVGLTCFARGRRLPISCQIVRVLASRCWPTWPQQLF